MRPVCTWIVDLWRGRRRNRLQREESLHHICERLTTATDDNVSASREVQAAVERRFEASTPLRDVLRRVIERQRQAGI